MPPLFHYPSIIRSCSELNRTPLTRSLVSPLLAKRSLPYQTDPFPVAKATDENLTSENWEYILVRTGDRLSGLQKLTDHLGCLRQGCRQRFGVRNMNDEDDGLIMLDIGLIDVLKHRPKDAVAAMIKRLAHRNANVQLYTLEVGLPSSFPTSRSLRLT